MPPSSWAKKTGFRPKFSGETNAAHSGQISVPQPKPRESQPIPDLEMGRVRPPPNGVAQGEKVPVPAKDQSVKKRRDSDGVPSTNGQATPAAVVVEEPSQPRRTARHEELVEGLTVDDEGFASRHLHMKYELRDSPGLGITVLEFQVKVVSLSPFFPIVEILMRLIDVGFFYVGYCSSHWCVWYPALRSDVRFVDSHSTCYCSCHGRNSCEWFSIFFFFL